MGLKQELAKKKFDKRIVGFNIQTGVVTETDYKSHLESLQDDSANSETFSIEMEGEATQSSEPEAAPANPEY